MKTNKEITFNGEKQEFLIQLEPKKKRKWWWLLLLLLPLVLLIKIEKQIKVVISQSDNNAILTDIPVELSYPEYNVFKVINYSDTIEVTDKEGKAIFQSIKIPLFAYLFFNDFVYLNSENECFSADSLSKILKKVPNNEFLEIKLPHKKAKIEFIVIDNDDKEPIPEAIVTAYNENNKVLDGGNQLSSVAGTIIPDNISICSTIKIVAQKEGYHPDTLEGKASELLYGEDSVRTLRLRPLKDNIKFIVKDLKTEKTLQGVTATLKIEGRGTFKLTTNTNGVGVGIFDSVNINKSAEILAQKQFYYDTTKALVVKDFIKLEENERVIYMRPSAVNIVFRNLNEKNNRPISGVKNIVYINGAPRPKALYSNGKGEFIVAGVKNTDNISIVSSKAGYENNNSTIRNKKISNLLDAPQSKRDIKLKPKSPPPGPPPRTDDLKGKGGDLRINLQWFTTTDLDLHVYDPCGNEIWFSKRTGSCRGGKGELDIDANALIGTTRRPQENIYFVNPAKGPYKVVVVCFKYRGSGTTLPFNISIVDKNGRKDYKGKVIKRKRTKVTVVTHTVN